MLNVVEKIHFVVDQVQARKLLAYLEKHADSVCFLSAPDEGGDGVYEYTPYLNGTCSFDFRCITYSHLKKITNLLKA